MERDRQKLSSRISPRRVSAPADRGSKKGGGGRGETKKPDPEKRNVRSRAAQEPLGEKHPDLLRGKERKIRRITHIGGVKASNRSEGKARETS